jgi:hypothetical protein
VAAPDLPDDVSRMVPDGITPPAGVPAEIFAVAVDTYVARQRLDMQALGRQLGVPRIVALIASVMRGVERDESLRAFLEADPELALRILTGTRSRVQRGIHQALESLLLIESERGAFAADVDASTLAYALVRIAEGFLYADLIADRIPDTDRAVQLVEALLRGLDTANRG